MESKERDGDFTRRPLCQFCSAPWTDNMIATEEELGGYYPTCAYSETYLDITCHACGRLIHRKPIDSLEEKQTGGPLSG